MRLIELQRRFQATILDPAPPRTRELGMVIPERIAVHHSHFWNRMRDIALACQPLLAKMLPADELREVIRRYLTAHPPAAVSAFGVYAGLAEFLGTAEPWSDWPIIAELAAFDYQRSMIGSNAEEITVSAAKLAAIDPAVVAPIRFRLKKRSALLVTRYRFEVARIHVLARATPLDAEPTHLLLHMVGRRYAALVLDPRGYRALEPLVAGTTLAGFSDHLGVLGFGETEARRLVEHVVDSDLLVATSNA